MAIPNKAKKNIMCMRFTMQTKKMYFKYGISDKPIGKDGQSRRMKEQSEYLNRAVGWFRYHALLLFRGIIGRPKALEIEQDCIDTYTKKCGRPPRGNLD